VGLNEVDMSEQEYLSKLEKILERVPAEYHEGVKRKAWDDGHSNGYSEVLLQAEEIADVIFGCFWEGQGHS